MTLRSYLRVLRERWRLVVLTIVLATGIAVLITALTPRVYQANVQLFVASNSDSNGINSNYSDAAFVQTQVQTFARIVASPEVTRAVIKNLNLSMTPSELAGEISADATTGESIVNLHVQDTTADRAAAIANEVAQEFRDRVVNVYYKGSDSVRMFITSPADAPSSPVAPQPVLNIALGLLLGVLAALTLALARDVLDNRVKDPEKLAKTAEKPVMGIVIDDPKAERHPVATRAGTRNIRAENFRQLRANLQFANVDEHPRIIAVTSSIPTEGKTMVAMNLASTLAEAGFTVCLVDADLRRPTVAKLMGLPSQVGLTSVLLQQLALDDALQRAGSGLYVLSSGPTPPNPSEVLASTSVRETINELLTRVDYVILDTAPLLPVADGSEVAALADGVLLVARYNLTTEPQVRRSRGTLRQVDATLLGVVLNRVPNRRRGPYGYGYSYYRTEEPGPSGNKPTPRRSPLRRTKQPAGRS